MREQRELINKIITKLKTATSDLDVRIIASKEQEEKRADNMVVVGITNVTNVNPGLPDYDFSVNILIDSRITADREGHTHDAIVQTVEEYLQSYLTDQSRLSEMFQQIPIVGMFLNNKINTANDESNQTVINLQLIGSY